MWKVRNIKELVENVVLSYSETEQIVREATNDEPWGPTGAMLTEVAELSYKYGEFNNLMKGVWERLKDVTVWRHVYKTLLVIDYLLKYGSERVIEDVRENINQISKLIKYTYTDDDEKDQSKNIHHRAKEIISLINDKSRLDFERRNALHVSSTEPAQTQASAIFSEKQPSPPTNKDVSIMDMLKNSVIVTGIKNMLILDEPADKDVDDELSPITYKNPKTDENPTISTQAQTNIEVKKEKAAQPNVDLFANFDDAQKPKINESNNEFGNFSSSQPKEIQNKQNDDLMGLFSMPSGNSNFPANQQFSNMYPNPPTDSRQNIAQPQLNSMNFGFGAQNNYAQSQNSFMPASQNTYAQPQNTFMPVAQNTYAQPQNSFMPVAQNIYAQPQNTFMPVGQNIYAHPQNSFMPAAQNTYAQPQNSFMPVAQNTFAQPQNATNFNQTARPVFIPTQTPKKEVNVDTLLNQNMDNLFSTTKTSNSSFNSQHNTFSPSSQTSSFNQTNAFNSQKPNNQPKYF